MQNETNSDSELMKKAADTIRCLSMDAIQKAGSGHPGMPMGTADMALTLWLKHLKFNPSDPLWPDRDRFVLSAGHGSMLLYSLLHISGYDLPMSQIMQFRQWESITPGHPEFGHTPGVETTTGPLGQGFANGVGMALAERHLAGVFNEQGFPLVDHFTYGIVSDGDLMEGISSEAASFAGHLGLGKLIFLYDCNRITIEGATSLTFETEDVKKRFDAYGWHTLDVDGHDMDQVNEALEKARNETGRPTLILARTHIAKGSPNLHDTAKSHGAPLGEEEVALSKKNLGCPGDPFHVPEEVYQLFRERTETLKDLEAKWNSMFEEYRKKFPDRAEKWNQYHMAPSPEILEKCDVTFEGEKPVATRAASGKVMQSLAKIVPNLVGGSADLAPSNKTYLNDFKDIGRHSFTGRNIRFGIREHAMGGILNGMALHGGVIPFGGTFLVFSDYMRASIRLASLMGLRVVYVFTHDSIFVGEDGPTHQPIEHIMSLRLIPGLTVIRPSDATETLEAWKTALSINGPTALILTRQGIPIFDRETLAPASGLSRGAYVLEGGEEETDGLLIASGSEVDLAMRARKLLLEKGVRFRVISFPSWEIFEKQPDEYRKSVFPDQIPTRLAIEMGRGLGWEKYVGEKGEIHSMDRFGASAPGNVLAEKFGFSPGAVMDHALEISSRNKGEK